MSDTILVVNAGSSSIKFSVFLEQGDTLERERICQLAVWLGVEIDPAANAAGHPRISAAGSRIPAWVIPTNEELMIARHTRRIA